MEQVQNAPPSLPGFCCGRPKLTSTLSFCAQSGASSAPSGTSSSTRAASPTRRLHELRDSNPAIYYETIYGSTESPCPASIIRLRDTLAKDLNTVFIPVCLKVRIYLLQFEQQITLFKLGCNLKEDPGGCLDIRDSDFDEDYQGNSTLAQPDVWSEVLGTFQSARDCHGTIEDENAWSMRVVVPLFELILRSCCNGIFSLETVYAASFF